MASAGVQGRRSGRQSTARVLRLFLGIAARASLDRVPVPKFRRFFACLCKPDGTKSCRLNGLPRTIHSRYGENRRARYAITFCGLLLLSACTFSIGLKGQTATPSQPASEPGAKRSSTKSRRKRPAKTTRKPVIARKTVRKPPPVRAEIPEVVEPASVWRGCLEAQDLPKLSATFKVEQRALVSLLEENGIGVSQGAACTAYVAATGGEGGVASAVFMPGAESSETRLIALRKTGDEIIVTPGLTDLRDSTRRELSLPAREFAASLDSLSPSIAANLRWQLDILVPRMLAPLPTKATAETESSNPVQAVSDGEAGTFATAGKSIDDYTVRLVLGRDGDGSTERLISAEVLQTDSGKRVDGVFWLDRPDGDGVIIGMEGAAYERLLWESPVKYTRSSRGVGPSVTTYRRRVASKKGSTQATVRTVKVSSYHLGVDMMAPKGTDVHAVGDAEVAFAGRKNGFGNVIILDHGRGYQTYYAHLSKISIGIKAGVRVARGDVIGLVGSTGRSTAPHLHFETRKDTHYLDPFDETHQLGLWLLTADEQERLAAQLLSATPVATDEEAASRRQ